MTLNNMLYKHYNKICEYNNMVLYAFYAIPKMQ